MYSLKPLWSELEEAPISNINEFSQLFSRQAVEPKVAKKKVQQKKKTEVSLSDSFDNYTRAFIECILFCKLTRTVL